jgi:serine/threonine protein kinase/formylglycine-generating enzyme required for sulfatase activity
MDDSDRCTPIERLYAEFLQAAEEDDALQFESFVAAHPEHRAELLRIWNIDRATRLRGTQLFFRPELLVPVEMETGPKIVEPKPGSSLGPYDLFRKIGQGGMGQVWEARERGLDRRVALKLLNPGTLPPRALEHFEREARACARIHHPGVVVAHAAGEIDGVCYIAEELVESGVTLSDSLAVLRSMTALPSDYYRSVARLFLQIADALVATHESGVIHRDVKPRNILIAAGDRPVITDFGLARILSEDSLSSTGEVAGTYAYMSPEQIAQHQTIDPRTDVFSLGVVFYEALTLTRPFDGDTAQQVMHKIVNEDPLPPRRVRSRVPAELDVICRKAMEKERDRRYSSMAAFAADLRHFLGHEPIKARAPGPGQRVAKWSRRNPVKATIAAVAISALVVISVLTVFLQRAKSELSREIASVKRLSAMQDLENLIAQADEQLWPVEPKNIGSFQSWIEEARILVGDLPLHLARREELANVMGARPDTEHGVERWWEIQLAKLIERLETLSDEQSGLLGEAVDAVSVEHGWSVPRRLAFAQLIERNLAGGGGWAARWEEARVAIGEHPSYGGLDLEVQVGLIPIGQDPGSDLWEFWHAASGDEPERDAGTGVLQLTPTMGMVLVLVPGGSFSMGAQSVDPSGANHDPRADDRVEAPVHPVTLSPFFLSKYEVTQGQWLLLSGDNPSFFNPSNYRTKWNATGSEGSLLHPVEKLDWFACDLQLRRAGLALPSEAQWEYAARGRSMTPWWPGEDPALLSEVGNVTDAYCANNGGAPQWDYGSWDDGQAMTAPVGSYLANFFGLNDVHGNVFEWVLDGSHEKFYEDGPETDPVAPPSGNKFGVIRGGGYCYPAIMARVTSRGNALRTMADDSLGVRAGRSIHPSPHATRNSDD